MSHVPGRRLAALATVALAATVSVPAAASAKASPPACQTAQLVAYVSGENGAAGTIFSTLQFANLGGACTLGGFPGVWGVCVAGWLLGAAARKAGGNPVKTITLKAATASHWSTASTTLGITEAANFPDAKCTPTLAAGLRIYPPGQRAALAVPMPFEACRSSAAKLLQVRAVK